MLEHWIKPLDKTDIDSFFVPSGALGERVIFEPGQDIGAASIAIIGADPKWSRMVRQQLYRFASRPLRSQICDLGDLRRLQSEFVVTAVQELTAAGICPVIIGARPDMALNVMQTLNAHLKLENAVLLHEALPGWLTAKPDTCSAQCIGTQGHVMHQEALASFESQDIPYIRLGQVRGQMAATEPLLRDAQMVCLDLSVLRYPDFPAQSAQSTSGLTSEETCQLMRYAGMGTSLRAMVVTGHDPMSTQHGQSANTMAQMIWYFIDGFDQKVQEHPSASPHFTHYAVQLQDYDHSLVFHKSEKSGRWWVELPGKRTKRWFSCGYDDYQRACDNVISERVYQCLESI